MLTLEPAEANADIPWSPYALAICIVSLSTILGGPSSRNVNQRDHVPGFPCLESRLR